MKIHSTRGSSVLLIETSKGKGRILNMEASSAELSAEMPIDSFLLRGYWEPWSGTDRAEKDLLAVARGQLQLEKTRN